jgi:hypothetical protein
MAMKTTKSIDEAFSTDANGIRKTEMWQNLAVFAGGVEGR